MGILNRPIHEKVYYSNDVSKKKMSDERQKNIGKQNQFFSLTKELEKIKIQVPLTIG